jgi:hypothetical protein
MCDCVRSQRSFTGTMVAARSAQCQLWGERVVENCSVVLDRATVSSNLSLEAPLNVTDYLRMFRRYW